MYLYVYMHIHAGIYGDVYVVYVYFECIIN